MPLLTLENVMKQENDRTILKNLSLMIEETSQIGIKMTHHESLVFFQLLSGELAPSSGHFIKETSCITTEFTGDALYEGLTAASYLSIFKKLANFQEPLETFIGIFSLSDIWHTRISRLSLEQKKRISLFRMFLFSPRLVLLQSPLNKATDEGIELYLQALNHLRANNTAVVCTSTFLEELLLLSNEVYRYNQYNGLEQTDLADSRSGQPETPEPGTKSNKVYKVSSRLADKTIFSVRMKLILSKALTVSARFASEKNTSPLI